MSNGYRLTDVEPGFARVVRPDGSLAGHVIWDDGAWRVTHPGSGGRLQTSFDLRRPAVAALVAADLAEAEEPRP